MALLEKLIDLVEQDDAGSTFFALKNLLGVAASGLTADGSLPSDPKDRAAFQRIQECLFELRKPSRPALQPNGVIWRGRPGFLTDEVLNQLIEEVEAWRPNAAVQKWGQYISPGGNAVAAFANSPELLHLVNSLCGEMESQNYPSCLYYDVAGAHIKPHVDTDNFCVNVNLMLVHSDTGTKSSELVTYPFDGEPERIQLQSGEMIIMYADCVVHTRTPVAEGEVIRNITFGFKPAAELHQLSSDLEA